MDKERKKFLFLARVEKAKVKLSKEILQTEYIENNREMNDICKEYKVSCDIAYKLLSVYGLKRPWPYKDYTGKVCGKVKVIRRFSAPGTKNMLWLCWCPRCKKEFVTNSATLQKYPKTCKCRKEQGGSLNSNWTGYGEISGSHWASIKKGAKERNLECNITIEQIWELFLKQERKCALTGMPISFHEKQKDKKFRTASLDRIDNSKGYTIDNIQWVHKYVNSLKRAIKEDIFIQICNLVSRIHTINLSPEEIESQLKGEIYQWSGKIEKQNKINGVKS